MARFKITTPVANYTGDRAGVHFVKGVAEVDSETQLAALRYFRSAGYGVEPVGDSAAEGGEGSDPDTGGDAAGGKQAGKPAATRQAAAKAPTKN